MNIKDKGYEFQLELAVPGYKKEDPHVNLEIGVLTISGKKREEKKEELGQCKRREFRGSSVKRSFSLTQIADEAKVRATFKDGVLQLSVPKLKELAKAKAVKEIAIG